MSEIREAMAWLGRQPDVLFVGQGVTGGTRMSASFEGIDSEKLIEFPVAEELQMGVCVGLSLEGFVPVSVFPRMNFLLRAMDQLVNHLDRLPLYSGYRPRVVVRTSCERGVLDAGEQHSDDFSEPLRRMLKTVRVRQTVGWDAEEHYRNAYRDKGSTVVVES